MITYAQRKDVEDAYNNDLCFLSRYTEVAFFKETQEI